MFHFAAITAKFTAKSQWKKLPNKVKEKVTNVRNYLKTTMIFNKFVYRLEGHLSNTTLQATYAVRAMSEEMR